MSDAIKIPLWDLRKGDWAEADLHPRVDLAFADRADFAWQTYLAMEDLRRSHAGEPKIVLEHSHWKWAKKLEHTGHLLSMQTLGVECDGQVEGMMMLVTDGSFGRLPEHKDKPLVYVEYLASAPWNLPAAGKSPKFRGVGTVLIRAAIEASKDLEFKGRLALHSLPGSEEWYKKLGFQFTGTDKDLKHFELTEGAATALEEGRTK